MAGKRGRRTGRREAPSKTRLQADAPAPEDPDERREPPVAPSPAVPEPLDDLDSSLNGFGVPDWLIEPLAWVASAGFPYAERRDVPARLAHLAGTRPRKLSSTEREHIHKGLGSHERFTAHAISGFRATFLSDGDPCEGKNVDALIEEIDEVDGDPILIVSTLVATDRLEEARKVAAWFDEEDDFEPSESTELLLDLAEKRAVAVETADAALELLGREEKRSKKLERRLKSAQRDLERARREVIDVKVSLAETRKSSARSSESSGEAVEALKDELQAARRERRDLVGELTSLQGRFLRVRQVLRETRAKLPPQIDAPPLAPAPREPPPSHALLHSTYAAGGVRALLDLPRLLVVVDGYNVGLGRIRGVELATVRHRLETALQHYQTRTTNKVLVVYDGRKVSWFYVPHAGRRPVERIFTAEDEIADDRIVFELEEGFEGLAPVVVTSDRELAGRCRARGAFVVSSRELLKVIKV